MNTPNILRIRYYGEGGKRVFSDDIDLTGLVTAEQAGALCQYLSSQIRRLARTNFVTVGDDPYHPLYPIDGESRCGKGV